MYCWRDFIRIRSSAYRTPRSNEHAAFGTLQVNKHWKVLVADGPNFSKSSVDPNQVGIRNAQQMLPGHAVLRFGLC